MAADGRAARHENITPSDLGRHDEAAEYLQGLNYTLGSPSILILARE